MARRKTFALGPKRKSYSSGGMRVNTKGYRVTSTSFGPKGARVNMSKRGMKMNGRSCAVTLCLMIATMVLAAQRITRSQR